MADSFEDWHDAARQYAAEHPELELWDFQIEAMASDWAWRWEGSEITPQRMERAYQDWISGNNPYSVHTVQLEGYDNTQQWARMKEGVRKEYIVSLLTYCMDIRNIDRFLDSISQDIYFDKEKAWKQLLDWNSGKNSKSPHHVPFDPVNLREREERKQELHARYPQEMKDDVFWFMYEDKLEDQTDFFNGVKKRVAELLAEDPEPVHVKRIRNR